MRPGFQQSNLWYRKAADQGSAFGQLYLGLMYGEGKGIEIDHTEALTWYRKAAAQELPSAQTALGYTYQYRLGVKKDLDKSLEWYRKAAQQGDESAKEKVVQMEKELNK